MPGSAIGATDPGEMAPALPKEHPWPAGRGSRTVVRKPLRCRFRAQTVPTAPAPMTMACLTVLPPEPVVCFDMRPSILKINYS